MDLRTLKYFKMVADTGNFTEAANKLNISQPSLSNTIKSLESQLSVKLIERSTKMNRLTEAGEILYKNAKSILNEFSITKREMQEVSRVGGGKIIIGMIESAKYWIPPVIKLFHKQYPNVKIKLKDMGPKSIEKELQNYEIHLGITTIISDSESIKNIPLFKDNIILINTNKNNSKKLETITLKELEDKILIHSLAGYYTRDVLIKECNKRGFEPLIKFETESLETALQLVKTNIGAAVVPNSFTKNNEIKNIGVYPFEEKSMKRVISAVYLNDIYLPPSVHDFIDLLQNYCVRNLN